MYIGSNSTLLVYLRDTTLSICYILFAFESSFVILYSSRASASHNSALTYLGITQRTSMTLSQHTGSATRLSHARYNSATDDAVGLVSHDNRILASPKGRND
ncbi:hypothetical protein CC77DRAFT_733713 [Alternaria alternata]|uniref:Uncharacterized protein n=1 Tax=Alternaria alternata TaxID=5599 RepID=A0A177DUP4_ALTAL|nr:hypothetical protein CC77DRAFT_733713 [Alternaria alternata]OAG22509.1 hypothetical protein CC77DRAFT_733713 [Alternaria alternata]